MVDGIRLEQVDASSSVCPDGIVGIRNLLRSNCGIVETDAPEAIIEKVRSGLQEVGMDPEQDSPVLLHLLGVKEVGNSPALSNPEAVKAKAFEIFRQLSVNGSRSTPAGSGAR